MFAESHRVAVVHLPKGYVSESSALLNQPFKVESADDRILVARRRIPIALSRFFSSRIERSTIAQRDVTRRLCGNRDGFRVRNILSGIRNVQLIATRNRIRYIKIIGCFDGRVAFRLPFRDFASEFQLNRHFFGLRRWLEFVDELTARFQRPHVSRLNASVFLATVIFCFNFGMLHYVVKTTRLVFCFESRCHFNR